MGILIGISGCSASGKSTFVKELNSRLEGEQIRLIQSDSFYKENLPVMISADSGKCY